jgi:hypothetical protein
MSIGIGIGFMAMSSAGVWGITTGEPIGLVPALVGAGLAAGEFHEAREANPDINNFRAQIAVIED